MARETWRFGALEQRLGDAVDLEVEAQQVGHADRLAHAGDALLQVDVTAGDVEDAVPHLLRQLVDAERLAGEDRHVEVVR